VTNSVDVWTFDTRSQGLFGGGGNRALAMLGVNTFGTALAMTQSSAGVDEFFGTLADAVVPSTLFGHRRSPAL